MPKQRERIIFVTLGLVPCTQPPNPVRLSPIFFFLNKYLRSVLSWKSQPGVTVNCINHFSENCVKGLCYSYISNAPTVTQNRLDNNRRAAAQLSRGSCFNSWIQEQFWKATRMRCYSF